jgi:hypothetical protein
LPDFRLPEPPIVPIVTRGLIKIICLNPNTTERNSEDAPPLPETQNFQAYIVIVIQVKTMVGYTGNIRIREDLPNDLCNPAAHFYVDYLTIWQDQCVGNTGRWFHKKVRSLSGCAPVLRI